MRYYRFLLAGTLLAAPLAGFAQSPLPRYYAGLGVYSSSFQRLGSHYGRTTVPVQVQVGYRWHPRWAVQLGVAYNRRADDYDDRGQYLDPTFGNPVGDYSRVGHDSYMQLSATLLARRTLTRQPAHRFQFDLVGGLTYEYGNYHNVGHYISTYPAYPADQSYDDHFQSTQLYVGVGPGVRFQAAPRLAVAFDVLLNAPLGPSSNRGFSSGTSLGLRYYFGTGS